MRIALISDIHGNHMALEAVLDHVRRTGADGIVFLGDYVTDFPGSHQVLEMVRESCREWDCRVLRGNREDYLINHRRGMSPGWEPGSASGSLLFAYNSLTEEDLDYIGNLPYVMDVHYDGAAPFTACHSSPRGARDPIAFNEPEIAKCLELIDTDYMFCGHQHITRTYCHLNKRAFFIGSTGLCDGMGGHAQFAYVDFAGGQWLPRVVTIPYDVEAAVAEFETSGLINMGKAWSRAVRYMALTGYDASVEVVRRANAVARSLGIRGVIPEEIWQRAASDAGIP